MDSADTRINYDALKSNVSPAASENISHWLTEAKYADYQDELTEMIQAESWQELEDAFFTVLEFGTAGRRGTTGIGSNRINRVTMGESAQALCEYAKQFDDLAPEKGIVIACDTRLTSEEFTEYIASVCAANGFRTYVFDGYRSTPELSFAVRELGCAVGIVVSASHNPPADNGFKAYWSDGGQLVSPHDKGVLKIANAVEDIHSIDYKKAVEDGKITVLDADMDEKYIAAVAAQVEGTARNVSIVYSPLHGAGQRNTLPVLERAGFENVSVVSAQMEPDGNFPTIENGKPNPEEKAANDRAVAQMLAENADIAITNDPDADRIGVMVRQGEDVVYLSGNQSAALATEYTLRKRHERGALQTGDYIAKTIVTTDLMQAVADKYHVKCYGNLLIGFKYFCALMESKKGKPETFLIGAEESYGLLKGMYARDKDGAAGALPLAEYAAELKAEGKTLYDRLLELYQEYGLYLERMDTVVCPGARGFEQMQTIMNTLRTSPPLTIAGHKVSAVLDYTSLKRTDTETHAVTDIDCLAGNIVTLELDGNPSRRITVRPSGTEPKLKLYTMWHGEADQGDIGAQLDQVARDLEGMGRELEGLLLES
jgi:phosphoglucomutase/phosphomannomutase